MKTAYIIIILVFIHVLAAASVSAGTPTVSNVIVTDVTPFSFSAAWVSSEASQSGLNVFTDQDGTMPVSVLTVEPQPILGSDTTIQTLAEDMGVLKVRVSGLSPDTVYYFETVTTSKADSIETRYPAPGFLIEVITEVEATCLYESESMELLPFSNDLMLLDAQIPSGMTSVSGSLMIVQVEGTYYPVSSFIGDATPNQDQAFFDLNNLFSSTHGESLQVEGGENLNATQYMGSAGNNLYALYQVPSGTGTTPALQTPAAAAQMFNGDYDGDLDVDGKDLAVFAQYFQNSHSMADVDGNGFVDTVDVAEFAAFFGVIFP